MKFRKINNIFFVGIGGIGMSGIAELLHNLSFSISGSDMNKNENVISKCSFSINKSGLWMIVGKKKFCYIVDVCVEIEPRLSEEVMCRFRFVHHTSKVP